MKLLLLCLSLLGAGLLQAQKVINLAFPVKGLIELTPDISIPKIKAGYTLWMVQRTFFGPGPQPGGMSDETYQELTDANWVDMVAVVVLTVPIFLVGIWPSVITDTFKLGIEAAIR